MGIYILAQIWACFIEFMVYYVHINLGLTPLLNLGCGMYTQPRLDTPMVCNVYYTPYTEHT